MKRKRLAFCAACAAAALLLSACGDGDSASQAELGAAIMTEATGNNGPEADHSAQTADAPVVQSPAEGSGAVEATADEPTAQRSGDGSVSAADTAPKTTDTAETVPVKKEYRAADTQVGLCLRSFDDQHMQDWRAAFEEILTGELSFSQASLTVVNGKADQEEQRAQVERLLADGADVLVVDLVQPSAAPDITDLCAAAGIPVVYIGRTPEADEQARWEEQGLAACYVGSQPEAAGRTQGELVLAQADRGDLNGDGVVSYLMIQGDPDSLEAQARTRYAVQAFADAGVQTEELFSQRGDWNRAKSQQLVREALGRFGTRVELVLCNDDEMALGALDALRIAGRTVGTDVYLCGIGAEAEAMERVVEGSMTGTVLEDAQAQARLTADAMEDLLSGRRVEAAQYAPYRAVTAENAEEVFLSLQGSSANP